MPRLTRMVLTLLLATVLAGTAALAQSPTGSVRPLREMEWTSADLFSRLWSLLAPWTKNGCEFDPSGRCLSQGTTLETGDNGCEVDPNGRCRVSQSPVQIKNGCQVDPDGRCLP